MTKTSMEERVEDALWQGIGFGLGAAIISALLLLGILAFLTWIFSRLAAFVLMRAQHRHREHLVTGFGAIWDHLTGKDEEDA